jgi:uracil-DNA glycosylase
VKKGVVEIQTAEPLIPAHPTLSNLREVAACCKACDLWKKGKQTIFGEGSEDAEIMMVGEQPGFQEDIEGRPFVGPAGKLLDKALDAAGILREEVYVTNVVKHFKWFLKGKRHMHDKPNPAQIAACRPWLDAEIQVVQPKVLVCLGATAAQALLGKDFRVTKQRGKFIESDLAPHVMATVHPSSLLRAPDDETRREQIELFIQDLKKIQKVLK